MQTENRAKRCIKLAVSLLVFFVDYARSALSRAAGNKRSPRCVVLYYHSIPAQLRAQFAKQMDTIIRWAEPISAGAESVPLNGARLAAVTFDDGYENVVENALPELMARSIPVTIFVVTAGLGRLPEWRTFSSDGNDQGKTMSASQLLALPPDLVTIGSHSATHPVLTSVDERAAKSEVLESRAMLEKLLERKVSLFSFPYGAWNDNLARLCREAGYERVFTIEPVLALTKPNEFVTGWVSVEPSDWPVEFLLKLLGAYRWLSSASILKRAVLSGALIRKLFTRTSSG